MEPGEFYTKWKLHGSTGVFSLSSRGRDNTRGYKLHKISHRALAKKYKKTKRLYVEIKCSFIMRAFYKQASLMFALIY